MSSEEMSDESADDLEIQNKPKQGPIDFRFPINPPRYEVQQTFAENVIKALDQGSNALLASPTGTGKTLALLCSTLAWQEQQQEKTIIYSSRCHSQLEQVVGQLRKTTFRPKVALIGSKSHYCINPEITKHKTENKDKIGSKCTKAMNSNSCPYYNEERILHFIEQNELVDIEDLKGHCQRNQICPYFYNKFKAKNANLILLPYNYLLQKSVYEHKIVNVRGNIVIFDEAHNVSSFAEEGQSFQIKYCDIRKTRDKFLKIINNIELRPVKDQVLLILQSLYQFCNFLANKQLIAQIIEQKELQTQNTEPIENLFEIINLNTKGYNQFEYGISCHNIGQYLIQCYELIKYFKLMNISHSKFQIWINFLKQLKFMYKSKKQKSSVYFLKAVNNELEIHVWCLDPSIAFKKLRNDKPHSIILTSGSLTPFQSWSKELKMKFKVKLNGPHVKSNMRNSVQAYIDTKLNFQYEQRDNEEQLKRLVQRLIQVASVIRKGILVVFTCYKFMKQVKSFIENSSDYVYLKRLSQLFWEPTAGEGSMNDVFENYKNAVYKGAILCCVHRGKVAEGIDFSDDLCRAVILIGIPYPCKVDAKVKTKLNFIDTVSKPKGFDGQKWYLQQAIRATNQAIGRTIRHVNDYGVILFLDTRFQQLQKDFSSWIRPCLQINESEGYIDRLIDHFMKLQNGIITPDHTKKQQIQQKEQKASKKYNKQDPNQALKSEGQQVQQLKRIQTRATRSLDQINNTQPKPLKLQSIEQELDNLLQNFTTQTRQSSKIDLQFLLN